MTLLPGVPGSRLSFQEEDVYDSRTDCLSLAVGLSTNSERSPPVLTGWKSLMDTTGGTAALDATVEAWSGHGVKESNVGP